MAVSMKAADFSPQTLSLLIFPSMLVRLVWSVSPGTVGEVQSSRLFTAARRGCVVFGPCVSLITRLCRGSMLPTLQEIGHQNRRMSFVLAYSRWLNIDTFFVCCQTRKIRSGIPFDCICLGIFCAQTIHGNQEDNNNVTIFYKIYY